MQHPLRSQFANRVLVHVSTTSLAEERCRTHTLSQASWVAVPSDCHEESQRQKNGADSCVSRGTGLSLCTTLSVMSSQLALFVTGIISYMPDVHRHPTCAVLSVGVSLSLRMVTWLCMGLVKDR